MPGSLSIPESGPEETESGRKVCRVARASGQIPEFHSVTFVTHVNHGGPGCKKKVLKSLDTKPI